MAPVSFQAAVEFAHSPLLTFIIGLMLVVALLVWPDLPAFIGLIISAFLVGVVNTVFVADFTAADAGSQVATALGNGMAGIGIPILMAAIIGKGMLESGAAQRSSAGSRASSARATPTWRCSEAVRCSRSRCSSTACST